MSVFSRYIIAAFVISSIGLISIPCFAGLLNSHHELGKKAERIYFDPCDFPIGEESFHIHVGDNLWIQTTTVHRDMTGFYTYASDVCREPGSVEYQRMWKCPYCNRYWPLNTPCQNPDCPSKY